ncbi:MAG: dihydrofolate reductase [Acidobacteriota bacterium]|jgi:dihydrofolate reductase
MIVSLIAAMAENRVIGSGGGVPWHLPSEQRYFKRVTLGHPVIMGRKTFETLNVPLEFRRTIVVTRQRAYPPGDYLVAPDLESALDAAAGRSDEVFVAGGGEIYRQAMPLADRIYLTVVHRKFEGDVTFPEIPSGEFEEISRRDETADAIPYSLLVFERRRPA